MMFYLLSLTSGILECGWIAYGAVHELPLWQILCFPLAYHIGNLFPKPFSLNKKCLLAMSAASFAAGCLTLVNQLPQWALFMLTCASLFMLSTVIQSVRSGLKNDGSRLIKRIFRTGGFVLAPLAAAVPSLILTASAVLAAYGLKDYNGSFGIGGFGMQNGFSAVMLFHQLHYFFYAHITLASVSLMLSQNYPMGAVYAALLFCGTWITYMSAEPVLSKLTSNAPPLFYAGHIGIAVLLAAMNFAAYSRLFIILWLATGFFGGVVYTVSAMAKAAGVYNRDSMTVSENIGHTLGIMTAAVMAAVCGGDSPKIMLLFGAVSAVLAVISMIFISGKENLHENIHSKC